MNILQTCLHKYVTLGSIDIFRNWNILFEITKLYIVYILNFDWSFINIYVIYFLKIFVEIFVERDCVCW